MAGGTRSRTILSHMELMSLRAVPNALCASPPANTHSHLSPSMQGLCQPCQPLKESIVLPRAPDCPSRGSRASDSNKGAVPGPVVWFVCHLVSFSPMVTTPYVLCLLGGLLCTRGREPQLQSTMWGMPSPLRLCLDIQDCVRKVGMFFLSPSRIPANLEGCFYFLICQTLYLVKH